MIIYFIVINYSCCHKEYFRFQQEDNVSKQRMHIYNVCFTKPITCGPDINLPLPVLQNKTAGQSQAEDKNQVDNKSLSETTESVQGNCSIRKNIV